MYKDILDYGRILEETNPPPEKREILVHFTSLDDIWVRNEMIINDAFAYAVVIEIMQSGNIEARFVDECRRQIDWSNWE